MAKISPETLLARVRKTQDATLSDEEAAILETVAERSLDARRLLGMHYFRTEQFAKAVGHGRFLFKADPSREAAKNYLSILTRAGRFEDALALTEAHAERFDPIELADGRCNILVLMDRLEEAVEEGRHSLGLKDAQTPELNRPEPVVHRFDPSRPERNVISFSLYGKNPRYHAGAVRNAIVAQYLYPGWSVRFYIDDSVPGDVVSKLTNEGAQIRMAPKLGAPRYGLFWRFLVEDDPDVDIYLVRDADSVLNIRERVAVQAWLESGKPYHVMRDYPAHSELILAGMWGAHRGNLQPMGKRILKHVRERENRLNDRATDQLFLRLVVWPEIRRDALVHDSRFNYGNASPFPDGYTLPWPMHVGQNDWARVIKAARDRAEQARLSGAEPPTSK